MEKKEEKSLSRNLLLQKEELEKVKVDLGKGEFVFVRQMTGRERDNFEQSLIKEKKNAKGEVVSYDRALGDFRAKLAVVTVCDEEGKALFLPDDYSLLSQNMSAKRLEIIVNAAQKLNAISEEDKEALVKNSSAEPEDNSSSDSAKN
jgi:ABC-type ATPase involved in cell division